MNRISTLLLTFFLLPFVAGAQDRYFDMSASAMSAMLYPSKVRKLFIVYVALDGLMNSGLYPSDYNAYIDPKEWALERDVDDKSEDIQISQVQVLKDPNGPSVRLALYPAQAPFKKGDTFRVRLKTSTSAGPVTVYHSKGFVAIVDLTAVMASGPYSQKPADYEKASRWEFEVANNGASVFIPATDARIFHDSSAAGQPPMLGVSQNSWEMSVGDKAKLRLSPPKPESGGAPPKAIPLTVTVGQSPTPIEVPELAQPFTYSLEPSQAIKADLLDGRKVDVGHLDLDYTFPSFDFTTVNGYFKGKSTLSTNNLDTAGRLEMTFGIERYLSAGSANGIGWPMPAFLEVGIIGNQAFTNQSLVSSLGLRTLLPIQHLLYNFGQTKARSPALDVAVQYARLFKTDTRFTTPITERNMMRLTSVLDWKEIQLFGSKLLSVDLNAQVWYFPDKTVTSSLNVHSFESMLDAAITIPLKLSADKVYNLKLSYVTGAQESNNFARSATFGIGIELKK
jgi:hypothetical protein